MSIFKQVYEMMKNQDVNSLNKSLDDVHQKGLFSLVVGGTENGSLTRIFIATKKIKPFAVQLHSHCYDLKIGVICGTFLHHNAFKVNSDEWPESVKIETFKYKSPMNGGNGLTSVGVNGYLLSDTYIPEGGEIELEHDDIHTVSVAKGTMWIVQEQGFKTDESIVVGKRFILDGLYNKPKQYQVNDMWQKVFEELKAYVN